MPARSVSPSPQWRVMAALGRFAPLTASDVGQRIVMDKVAVSRAVAGLMKRGLVERATDRADRRRASLRLSARGRAMHARIVPMALGIRGTAVRGAERRGAEAVRHPEPTGCFSTPRPSGYKAASSAIRPPDRGGRLGREGRPAPIGQGEAGAGAQRAQSQHAGQAAAEDLWPRNPGRRREGVPGRGRAPRPRGSNSPRATTRACWST